MPNQPLSKLQSDARAAFRGTKLGKLLSDTHKSVREGSANVRSIMQAGHNMRQIAGQEATRELMNQMGLGNSWAMIERYAGKDAWKKIVGQLGSVGKILKSLSEGKTAEKPVGVERELEAAANLLKAFGYGVVKPGGGVSIAPQHAELRPEVQQAVQDQLKRQERISQRLKPLPGWPGTGNKGITTQPHPLPIFPTPQEFPVQMQTEMIPVSSSNVHSIGFRYDTADIGTLLVRYLASLPNGRRAGPGSLYEYFKVPSILFERFKNAASKGKFVWDELRIRGTVSGHKYNYDLTGITQEYVPRRAQLVYFRGPRGGRRVQERFVPRTFNLGEIRKGRLQYRNIRSQLPEQNVGPSMSVRSGKTGRRLK